MILIGASLSEPCIDSTVYTITLHFHEYRMCGRWYGFLNENGVGSLLGKCRCLDSAVVSSSHREDAYLWDI